MPTLPSLPKPNWRSAPCWLHLAVKVKCGDIVKHRIQFVVEKGAGSIINMGLYGTVINCQIIQGAVNVL